MKHFILAFLLQIHSAYAIDFESFIKILQDLSNNIIIDNVYEISGRPNNDKDTFDSMMVFAKTAIENDSKLAKVLISEIKEINNSFVKVAIFRTLSMFVNYKEELDKLDLNDEDKALKTFAYKINYRFNQVTYPQHLMLCFKATNNVNYILKIINYLDFDEATFKHQIDPTSIHNFSNVTLEKRDALIAYVFFLEAKTILKDNLYYENVKEILMNIPENLKTNNVEINVSEIINEPQNSIE